MGGQLPYWENSDFAEDEEEEGYVPDEELMAAAQLPVPPPLPPVSQLESAGDIMKAINPVPPTLAYHLGRDRYVTLSSFQGKTKLHVREYGTNQLTLRKFATTKGVCLDAVQLRSFSHHVDDIRASLHNTGATEANWHLGRMVFASFCPEFGQTIDLRNFFVPRNEHRLQASKKGVSLNKYEFDNLALIVTTKVESVWPAFRQYPTPCFIQHAEFNDEERAKQQCEYCSPLMNI